MAGTFGQQISEYEVKASKYKKAANGIITREKQFEKDTEALLEYVTWISSDLCMLRDRSRIAERIISDLKRSGEDSVDSLMETLGTHKKKQDDLDREVDRLRQTINAKEADIAAKEEEVTNLKRLIELETNEKEIETRRIRTEIEEQLKVIEGQKKVILELQVLNDYTQSDLVAANSELQSRIRERNDLHMRYLDADHETANLSFKQQTLEEQASKFERQIQEMNAP